MAKLVVHGAALRCSQGTAPSTLTILPVGPAQADEKPAATIQDMKPRVNIAPFGMFPPLLPCSLLLARPSLSQGP